MDSARGRRTSRKILLISLGVGAGGALLFGLWGLWAIERQWARMERAVDALAQEAQARVSQRRVLWGTPRPGEAWEKYEEAFDLFRKVMARVPDWRKISSGRLRPPLYLKTLEDLGPAFKALIEGAERERAGQRFTWNDLLTPEFNKDPIPLYFPYTVVLEAQERRDEGRTADAARLLLALAQLGRDAAENASLMAWLFGGSYVRWACDELHTLILLEDSTVALDVARALKALEEGFPQRSWTLRNEALAHGQMFLRDAFPQERTLMVGKNPEDLRPTWRHLFSRRAFRASAFHAFEDWTRRSSRLDGLAFSEVKGAEDRLMAEVYGSSNSLAGYLGLHLLGIRADLELRARLRLLMAAAHFRATGEVVELNDPMGARIRQRRNGRSLTVWSVWRNQVDDGGTGGWDSNSPDLVVSVERAPQD